MYPSWGCMRAYTPIENQQRIMSHRAECKTVHTSSYQGWKSLFWYIPVYTGIYRYIPVYTKKQAFIPGMRKYERFYIQSCGSWCDVDFQWGCMHAYTPMKGTSFTAVKSEKKIVQMMCLSTRVHTSIYQYILVCTITSHVVIQIRLEPPCETVSSLLPSCAVERPQRSSWPWFVDRQTTHILVHTCTTCNVCTSIYQYILVCTVLYHIILTFSSGFGLAYLQGGIGWW